MTREQWNAKMRSRVLTARDKIASIKAFTGDFEVPEEIAEDIDKTLDWIGVLVEHVGGEDDYDADTEGIVVGDMGTDPPDDGEENGDEEGGDA